MRSEQSARKIIKIVHKKFDSLILLAYTSFTAARIRGPKGF